MIKPLSPTGEELIFYNYKEPLKEVVNGYGYMGVILSTKNGERIQCHLCGKTFEELQAHVRQAHDMSNGEYKDKFGLAGSTSLISENIRQKRKLRTIEWMKNMSPEKLRAMRQKTREGYRRWKEKFGHLRVQPKIALETKNRRGTCPDQLLDKIRQVAKKVGHSPSKIEFIDHWKSQKYIHIIYKTFGSWDKAKEMAGYHSLDIGTPSRPRNRLKYSKEELIEYLQIFYQENGKPPTETDCRRGLIPESSIYRRMFGSFPEARKASGINDEVGRWIKK